LPRRHPERIPQTREKSKDPAELPQGFATGFDSLASRSLSLRPFRPSRGFPSRSILDFARNDEVRQVAKAFARIMHRSLRYH
jgi:hypothetical protein